jgi:hypothetical protein
MSYSRGDKAQSRRENQPERKHPFVPELYGDLVPGSFQNIFFGQNARSNLLSHLPTKFVPEIDRKKNLESMSEEDLDRLKTRAERLQNHATENALSRVSESTWESDIRSDLFGLIREDHLLRM